MVFSFHSCIMYTALFALESLCWNRLFEVTMYFESNQLKIKQKKTFNIQIVIITLCDCLNVKYRCITLSNRRLIYNQVY